VQGNLIAYAHYLIEDVRETPLDEKYFNFDKKTDNTYKISLRNEYKETLKGKITLPAKYKNEYITEVGDFKQSKITYIFFEKENKYITVGKEAFAECYDLKGAKLPDTIEYIEERAFGDSLSKV
jgi:hypothetical protein